MQNSVPIVATGHLIISDITDATPTVLLDTTNAIHPQNMARIFARALANESNHSIYRIAFGNGGTIVDGAFTVTYRTPNDGQTPDDATWDSRLYNETFSKVIDEGLVTLNPLLGTDPGSADLNTGVRPGGGAVPASDPPSVVHVSGPGVRSSEQGLLSEVLISAVINENEPLGQNSTDSLAPTSSTETAFVFDELGLFTAGASAINTSGYQYIDVGNRVSTDNCGLIPGQVYSFNIAVNGGTSTLITFTVPSTGGSGIGGQVLYGDLCDALNYGKTTWGFTGVNPLPGGARVVITDYTSGTFQSITGAQTYGFLKFESPTAGSTSQINLTGGATATFLSNLNSPLGGTLIQGVVGANAGMQNSPTSPNMERERLLTHLTFSPVLKAKNRRLQITYKLTISVARTPHN